MNILNMHYVLQLSVCMKVESCGRNFPGLTETPEESTLQEVKIVVWPITQDRSPAQDVLRHHLLQDYPLKTIVNKVGSHRWPSIAVFSTPKFNSKVAINQKNQ